MFDILVNPCAGNGKSLEALAVVEKTLKANNVEYVVHKTDKAGAATEIAAELNEKPNTKLIILGGDGTFNEVLNGISNFDTITLGLISCGTGNDFIRAAGIPADPQKAIDLILDGTVKKTDYIQLADGKRALNCAGAGMDVDVLVRYAEMKRFKGKLKYYAALLDTLIHLKFHKVNITVNGETEEKSVFLITVANGTCIGGGMPISPNSLVDDGYLTVVYVNEIKKSKVLPLLLKFLGGGKHINEPCTVQKNVKSIRVEILDEGSTEVDGEVSEKKVLDCRVVEGGVKIYR